MEEREKTKKKERETALFKDRFLLFELERQEQEGEAVTEAWAPAALLALKEDSCSQHFGLKET